VKQIRVAPVTPIDELVHEVFRFNGRLLAVGDTLVAHLGLTSARWEVIAAIAVSPTAQSVAGLGNHLGLRRQGVQRVVNELVEKKLPVSGIIPIIVERSSSFSPRRVRRLTGPRAGFRSDG
jgi:DNA-binding MarR family transcriptional regulator